MRTLLVFPPQAHPTQPALCLPSLLAYLRGHGFPDTHQRDLNLEAYEYFLSRERLELSRQRVRAQWEERVRGRPLALPEMDRYRVLAEAVASADAVLLGIDEARAVLRDPGRFFDHDRYLHAVKTLDRALRLISAEHYPSTLTAHNYTLRHSIEREEDVLAALADPRANFLVEYLEQKALPEILELRPDLLGISLTYTSQVIPGLSLAALVKRHLPGVHITVGGGLLAYVAEKLTRTGKVFDVLDSVIVLEGEGPLLELARAVERGRGIEEVPNCIHRQGGRVVTNAMASPLSIDDLPTPEFEGLPMDRYLSPQLALPLAITRGCYWEKCAFCTLYKVIGPGYRQRSMTRVMEDIETVTRRWNSDVVYFIVEDMPPPVFRALPRALEERGLEIRWWTDARLESGLFTPERCRELHRAGCRRIAFGFESASQRLLDLMEKGTCLEEADTIVRNLHGAGISVTLYTMIGFPTETAAEARQTLEWLRAHQEFVDEVSLRIFYVDHLSKVYAHPENYRVKSILRDPDKDLQVYYDWEPDEGMTRRQARELFFEFMKAIREEFPLFRGDNLLLFELKSHYFLYLCRHGDLGFLARKSSVGVGEPVPRDLERAVPRIPAGNRLLTFDYDLRALSEALNEAECSVLRPRYMSGSFKADLFRALDGAIPPAPPRPTTAVYRARSGDLLQVGSDAARVLEAVDGRRSAAEIAQAWPEHSRQKILAFLGKLLDVGLLTCGAASGNGSACAPEPPGEDAGFSVAAAGADAVRSAEAMHLYCKPSPG